MSRRKTIKRLAESTAFLGMGGLLWGNSLNNISAKDLALRPPAADKERRFVQSCLKCGKCVSACPHDILSLAETKDQAAIGTPFFEPRTAACQLCEDYPCITACPSGSLDLARVQKEQEEPDILNARMGLAVVHKESCIAFWGIQCDACYRACPLIDEAIKLEMDINLRTHKHANLKPVVNAEVCTGCGICENACVTEKPAIFVLPLKYATGEVGAHYVKGWDKEDEKRVNPDLNKKDEDKDVDSALDYLNSDDLLTD